uniref:Uncharacterized protein n=1 Tax=Anguilla anguilla TaxID=7936 RepID=A0A0E9T664_ANGAN
MCAVTSRCFKAQKQGLQTNFIFFSEVITLKHSPGV